MNSMRAIVLDETREVSQRAHHVWPPLGVRITLAESVQELQFALACPPPHHLLVVNLAGNVSGWQVAEQIRQVPFGGRTLVLVDNLARPDARCLRELPRTECTPRPSSQGLLDQLLKRVANTGLDQVDPSAPVSVPLRTFYGMVGKSPRMMETFSRIEKVAAGDASVCIYGESGTGKELIAYAIHCASPRRDAPFVPLDCTAIPEGLMESHLFGHVRGAFTGAVEHRDGVFSLAHTGTLFLDELCELSLPLQAKLLRVIQTREFVKVGGTRPIRTNVRLIMATNKDPKQQVVKGAFREDLYYRVAVVMIKVPSLRERLEDIPLLVEHFISRFSKTYQRRIVGIEASAMNRMLSISWPGNVRQLENLVEQAVVLGDGEVLSERDLFPDESIVAGGSAPAAVKLELGLPLREVERRFILSTLRAARGNRSETARRLGISLRCLQYKLKSYSETPETIGTPDELTRLWPPDPTPTRLSQ